MREEVMARLQVPHRLKVAAQVLEASEAFTAGLAGVRPLTRVASQVSLQICLPLHCVCAEWALKTHRRGGV